MAAGGQLLRILGHRIWQNYFMPSRLAELRDWYQSSLDLGYRFYSVESYWRLTNGGACAPPPKTILLRHDVDVDVAAARAMFLMETRLGIAGSYYFRLSTMDVPLMKGIAQTGAEASYHYEELALAAKMSQLRSSVDIRNQLPGICDAFHENLKQARACSGLPMLTVAAHGDWVNRTLKMRNTEVLNSPTVRERSGILVEAYDQTLLRFVTARYSDAPSPTWWAGGRLAETESGEKTVSNAPPRTPYEAVRQGLPTLYVLLHPEHWMRGPLAHFKEQTRRISEAVAYRCHLPSAFANRSRSKRIQAA